MPRGTKDEIDRFGSIAPVSHQAAESAGEVLDHHRLIEDDIASIRSRHWTTGISRQGLGGTMQSCSLSSPRSPRSF